MGRIWTPRRPRGVALLGLGRGMNPAGRSKGPVERLLNLVGLGHLHTSVPFMFHPANEELSADRRHYFYTKTGWRDCLGESFATATGTRIEMYDTSGANALPLLLLYFDITLTAGQITTLTGTAFKTIIGAAYSLDVANVSATSITPPDYANMVGWWDGAFATTLVNNDPITNWYANGYGIATLNQAGLATLKPTYKTNRINGRPTLYFDGGDRLDCNAIASVFSGEDKPMSVVAVIKRRVNTAYHIAAALGNTDASSKLFSVLISAISDKFYATKTDDVTVSKYPGGTIGAANAQVCSVVCAGKTISTWYQGTKTTDAGDVDVGTITINHFGMGCRLGSASFMDGDIAEMMLWKTAITDAQRIVAQNYLAAKWGITLA